MNDRYEGYGADQYELVGYDEFGQPVYRQTAPQQPSGPQEYGQQRAYGRQDYGQPEYGSHAPYGSQQAPQQHGHQGHGYGYDPYAAGAGQPAPQAYGTAPSASYDTYAQTAHIPQQGGPPPAEAPAEDERETAGDRAAREYQTGQFAFVEEPDGDSEDVIDWLNFTENRTERREEAKRRARSRMTALVVVLALVAVGGVGYLWYAGKLPGLSSDPRTTAGTTSAGAQKRDVIVVHLHNTKKGGTSTVLLVDNTTTQRGSAVLLPNSLALSTDDGTPTTLGKSVDDDGSSGTRDALDTVLGTDIQGTWRLDTPFLNNLVELVGNIEVDTNANVPDPDSKKKGEAPLVTKGEGRTLSGRTAVAYATYRAPGESENAQLERFGQVMQGVLRKVSSDPASATVTVQSLAQIIEPPLTDNDLGTFLAQLADLAKDGSYESVLLPVQSDGTVSEKTSDSVVRKVLGGTAKSPEQGAAVRVGVRNATGDKNATEQARVVLVNGGYTFIDAGRSDAAQAKSAVTYTDASDKQNAVEVAKTLGLPANAVEKSTQTSNTDVTLVLGQDYKAEGSGG